MSGPERFSCFLIGGDSLLVECGDILVARGHEVRGVITSTPRLAEWARGKGIRHFDAAADYRGALAERPFDYLFSITHLAVIPPEVLTLPRRWTINFHDGPLPGYAGLNAPAWALINMEKSYGITWHIATADLDRGDILKQKRFDIAPEETSLTLNTRCFEAAIETFSELVDELAAGTCVPRPQSAGEFSYYAKTRRPPAACLVDWRRSARELDALVRALDFGRYSNPVGVAKVTRGSEVFVVSAAAASDEPAGASPGVITAVNDEGIRVATGSGTLLLRGFSTVDGSPIPVVTMTQRARDERWDRFDELEPGEADRLTELGSALARGSTYWVRRLLELNPIEIPYEAARPDGASVQFVSAPVTVPDAFLGRYGAAGPADAVVAGLAAYLARLSDRIGFDVAFRDPTLQGFTNRLGHLVADRVPLRVQIGPDDRFEQVLSRIGGELAAIRRHRTWLHDKYARQPQLQGRVRERRDRLHAVVIEQCEDQRAGQPGDGTVLSFVVHSRTGTCLCICDSARIPHAALEAILQQAATFLEGLASEPDRPVLTQDILPASERRRILEEWNRTRVERRHDACVHELIEEQAGRTPDAIAVVAGAEQITYRQLNDRADRLASRLRRMSIGPDQIVGVCVERSADLVVSILGAMKAGGAYLPLDPAYPRDRLAFMIEDSGVPVIVTQSHLVGLLPSHGASILRIDADTD
jgi:methionyl-tRNA formyltransferase